MITETLFEMYYFHALIECFSKVFGARFLKVLKPSPYKEAWVGFDQGWVRTSLKHSELIEELQSIINTGSTKNEHFYLGYFLQYKCVQQMHRRSKYTLNNLKAPYYRVELSLDTNPRTNLSQHETLRRLCQLPRTKVYYACPMIFDHDMIYEEPDLSFLQCVDISTAPQDLQDGGRHFIIFTAPDDPNPKWCSEPTEGNSLSIKRLIESEERQLFIPLQANELIRLINSTFQVILKWDDKSELTNDKLTKIAIEKIAQNPVRVLPECFTIIHFLRNKMEQ